MEIVMKPEWIDIPVLSAVALTSKGLASVLAPAIRGVLKPSPFGHLHFCEDVSLSQAKFSQIYPGADACFLSSRDLTSLYESISQLEKGTRYVGVEDLGVFCCDPDQKHTGRMDGRVIIVTGGAQGFGKGIAHALLLEGATVILADLNVDLARETAQAFNRELEELSAPQSVKAFNRETGSKRCMALYVDVTDETSVEALCCQVVLEYGGIDVMYSNAGIVIAGDLENMTDSKVLQVMNVNAVGYFRCAKYASRYMKLQAAFDSSFTADILATSSIAGLVSYPKNYAYCASKFAINALTQCFAKELIPYKIKVNSVCPGNYYDGPLWNDPEKGLFVQYLKAGKIPNGKTVQDSVDFYMNREPFHRGAQPEDVALAVMYCIEQQFETGIALPATGGLAMGRS